MTTEVRFYPANPPPGVKWYGTGIRARDRLHGHNGGLDRMEVDGHAYTRATWDGQNPVVFPPKQGVKLLAPIQGMQFTDFEELGVALRSVGYLVTDLRKTVAMVNDPYVAMALLADRTVERFKEEIIIIRRLSNGTHADGIWQLDPIVFDYIRRAKLIHLSKTVRFGNTARQTFEWGPRTFDTLSEYHQVMLGYLMLNHRRRRLLEEACEPPAPTVRPTPMPHPLVAPPTPRVDTPPPSTATQVDSNVVRFCSRSPKCKSKVVWPAPLKVGDPLGTSIVVAHDNVGKPITMAEVTQEYVRAAPKGMPMDAVQFPKGCPDHELRKLTMIERIKHRRRMQEKTMGA